MRLTMFTDYALRTLILAASIRDRNVTIEETASVYDISAPHLKKVVRTLTQAGFLEAHRGRSGGFRLAVPAETINVGQVVRATETDFALFECLGDENRCVITPACRLKGIAHQARMALLAVFDRYSLADLVLDQAFLATLPVPTETARSPRRSA